MTPESQRIAIAEACGWERREPDNLYPEIRWLDLKNTSQWRSDYARRDIDLPDYLNDLNEMHAAVQSQSQDFKIRFDWGLRNFKLPRLVCDNNAQDWADIFIDILNAMAEIKLNE